MMVLLSWCESECPPTAQLSQGSRNLLAGTAVPAGLALAYVTMAHAEQLGTTMSKHVRMGLHRLLSSASSITCKMIKLM